MSHLRIRSTIETAFFQNNVKLVSDVSEIYNMATVSPGTIVTDRPVHNPECFGLPEDSKVLVFNDGMVTGRCAEARKIIEDGVDTDIYADILREEIYSTREKQLYHLSSIVGLDDSFTVKANLLMPEGHENIMLNWLLNFQIVTDEYKKMYEKSKKLNHEGEILIYSNPNWTHPDFPLGLALFDPNNNCAALLGLRYFGEHKKGTLTLAWRMASRNGFVPCHGGIKTFETNSQKNYTVGFFGLSGSGKSTLTHHEHAGKYHTKILHDDAFVISLDDGTSVALEPSYFDKTQDYPAECEDNKYLLTVQNCGVTRNSDGKVDIVTEDIRNGNGRAIKSKLWKSNRVDRFDEKINSIIWLMKDPTLPPVLKVDNPILASVFGATLATKRTNAERVSDRNLDQVVIEPYANPFRTYSLREDYESFKALFAQNDVECYIFNTGHFIDKKVPKEVTLGAIEKIVDGRAEFIEFCNSSTLSYMPFNAFQVNEDSQTYIFSLTNNLKKRLDYLYDLGRRDHLPQEAMLALETLILKINK